MYIYIYMLYVGFVQRFANREIMMSESAAAGISGDEWMGKTFDLSKAYKQLAILPAHQRHCSGRISCEWHLEILSKYLPSFRLHW